MNKYPKIVGVCKYCNSNIIAKNSGFDKKNRVFCSRSCVTTWNNKNIPWTEERRKKFAIRSSLMLKGRPKSLEHKIKMSLANKGYKSHYWKGGVSTKNRKLRSSFLAREWRKKVFKRDNYTCQACNKRNGNGYTVYLEAHHIKSWAKYPRSRYAVSNGITLCKACHLLTDSFGWKGNRNT